MGVDLTVTKHVYCCAEDGCPICSTDVRYAKDAGTDLSRMRDFLVNRPREEYQELFELHGIESTEFAVPGTAEEAPA
jgi:hypothetical protein